jgi:F-type H+-transporting ATPase subunit delta
VADRQVLIDGYAQALLFVAEAEGELDAMVDQLYAFGKALDREGRLREALIDPALAVQNKRAVVTDVFGERANPNVVNAVGFLVEQGRARELPDIVDALAALAAERRRHVVAEVRSAVRLDEARRRRLADALSRVSGRTVEVKVVIDRSVIGGVVARIGDEIFDGSVRTRLDDAREHLASADAGR